jgi:hypothetical protein
MTVERDSVEQFNPPLDWQELAQENGALRAIVAELLIKNQKLRWELLRRGCGPTHDPRRLIASEGTPFRKKSLTVVTP